MGIPVVEGHRGLGVLVDAEVAGAVAGAQTEEVADAGAPVEARPRAGGGGESAPGLGDDRVAPDLQAVAGDPAAHVPSPPAQPEAPVPRVRARIAGRDQPDLGGV